MSTPLYTAIVEESKKCDGTWTLSFLQSTQSSILRLPVAAYRRLINSLLDYIMDQQTSDLQRFKISQLLNSIKSNKKSQFSEILKSRMTEINDFCASLDDSLLAPSIKKLLASVYSEPIQKSSKNLRYKASSTEPTVADHTIPRYINNSIIF